MINKLDGNFSDDDEAGLTELAQHAAVALENCQQYEHLLHSRKQVTAEQDTRRAADRSNGCDLSTAAND